ncbi:hypothetical protein MTO96_039330 [Rhipicephalus appendiculatus]
MSNLARMVVFSVLLIALLVALLLLGRSSTWLADHDEITGNPEGHQHLSPLAAGVAKGRSSGVGSWMRANSSRPLSAGAKDKAKKRPDTHMETTKTSTQEMETTEGVTSPLVDMPGQVTRRAKNQKKCGALSFTFCGAPMNEFYFDGSQGACLSVADLKEWALCNRGANKFPVLFTQCKRQDVEGPLWFFNGDRCEQWNFPAGLCPAINNSGGSLFGTPEECKRSCQEPGSRTSHCGAPWQVACTADRMKQPFFANMAASGTTERCLKATPQNLAGHLCLAGKNRFDSLEACKKACVGSARS